MCIEAIWTGGGSSHGWQVALFTTATCAASSFQVPNPDLHQGIEVWYFKSLIYRCIAPYRLLFIYCPVFHHLFRRPLLQCIGQIQIHTHWAHNLISTLSHGWNQVVTSDNQNPTIVKFMLETWRHFNVVFWLISGCNIISTKIQPRLFLGWKPDTIPTL